MSYFLKPVGRLKIVIENRTTWQTKLLRPFVARIAREEFPGTKPSNTRRRVTLIIGYNRGKGRAYCSGHAHLNSSTAYVNVPNPVHGKVFPVMDFCHVVGHEFGHCKGLEHAGMGLHYGASCKRGSYTNPHYAWAATLPIPVPTLKRMMPPVEEKRAAALAVAQRAVERWTRKRKLADTKLKVWTRKVRLLERRIAVVPVRRAACAVPHTPLSVEDTVRESLTASRNN